MRQIRKKPQLRRCGICGRVGHNKSTCSDFISPSAMPLAKLPVKFFVHHVSGNINDSASPHLINLKQNRAELWKKIETDRPISTDSPLYYFHHQSTGAESQPSRNWPPAKAAPSIVSPPHRPPPRIQRNSISHLLTLPTRMWDKWRQARFWDPFYWERAAGNFMNHLKSALPRRRLIISAAVLILVLVIPTQTHSYLRDIKLTAEQLFDNSTAGFMALQESTAALMNANLPTAEESLTNALAKFGQSADILQNKHRLLQSIISVVPYVRGEVEGRQKLITAGQKIALGNTYLLKGIEESQSGPDDTLTQRTHIITAHLKSALPNYKQALEDLSVVKSDILPLQYQSPFNDFKILFTVLIDDLQNLVDLGQSLEEIFGGQGLRRYLLIFQNPHELRPTGGFMGSFALMEIKDGKIINLDVPAGGTYDLQGQLSEYVEPPSPLLLSNKRWEFQDANWFPDFSASAQKILWFYRKSRQITVDGVIAINASVLERLLGIVGPLRDEARNLTITAANAISTIQQTVEEGPEKAANKPKQIIADLAPKFVEYLQNIKPKDLLPILAILQESLAEKDIQSYFTDSETENLVKSFGWGGKILATGQMQDYIFVVNTNIQGEKSDASIKQTISHQAVIEEDGAITDSVVVSREHTGTKGEKLYGATNINYLRLYVPEGSVLLSASGFSWPDENKFRAPDGWTKKDAMLNNIEQEMGYDGISGTRITKEFGKTVFGNWMITEPGQTSQVQFVYRLPFKTMLDSSDSRGGQNNLFAPSNITGRYQLVAQRQSGSKSEFESQIIFPDGWEPYWKDGKNMELATNGARIQSFPLIKDSVWSLVMIKK